MDTLQRITARIGEQLRVMTFSQRLAVGLCAALIAVSFMWLLQWSAVPEYVPLLDQPLSREEIVTIRQQLTSPFKVRGDRIYVRPADREELLLQLTEADALPEDTSIGFRELLADDSPFRPEGENEFRRRVALGNELARVIARSPAVTAAHVFINDASRRRIGRPSTVPTAAVHVTLAARQTLDQAMVEAYARLVSGAVAGLEPHRVQISDGVRAYSVPDREDGVGFGLLDERKKNEMHLLAKLRDQLAYIPGVLISVSVELDPSKQHRVETTYARSEPLEETTKTDNSSTGAPAGEAGTNPNVGVALSSGAGGTTTSRVEETNTYQPQKVAAQVTTEKPPYAIERVTASVGMPRSFLVAIYKAVSGSDAEPRDDDLVDVREIEKAKVRNIVSNVIMTKNDADVDVVEFFDAAAGAPMYAAAGGLPVTATTSAASAGELGMLRAYGPQVGLGGLALLSMVMMLMMVRKSARVAAKLSPHLQRQMEEEQFATTEDGVLTVAGKPIGQAQVSDSFLVGQEVDPDTLKYEQLAEQVTKMVADDPSTAADMIRRWVRADQ